VTTATDFGRRRGSVKDFAEIQSGHDASRTGGRSRRRRGERRPDGDGFSNSALEELCRDEERPQPRRRPAISDTLTRITDAAELIRRLAVRWMHPTHTVFQHIDIDSRGGEKTGDLRLPSSGGARFRPQRSRRSDGPPAADDGERRQRTAHDLLKRFALEAAARRPRRHGTVSSYTDGPDGRRPCPTSSRCNWVVGPVRAQNSPLASGQLDCERRDGPRR
jgi:hypothetical protein